MKIETFYFRSKGIEYEEDGLFVNSDKKIFVIVDAYNESYAGTPKIFQEDGGQELSGGEMVKMILMQTFQLYGTQNVSLEDILLKANARIKKWLIKENLHGNKGDRPGCSFAAVSLKENGKMQIIQGGDCIVLWKEENGQTYITENQVFKHDTECLNIMNKILKKASNNKLEMWKQFVPIFRELRERDVNNPSSSLCYASLNGDERISEYWISIETYKASQFLLFSDGMVPFEMTSPFKKEELISYILKNKKGGLLNILEKTREIEKKIYTSDLEASAISVEF